MTSLNRNVVMNEPSHRLPVRSDHGTKPMSEGPGESWIRPEVDLVNGETMTPLERMFAVADCANGIGTKLDIRKWTFMNTDLVVHVHRIPDGDWIGFRAETSYGP